MNKFHWAAVTTKNNEQMRPSKNIILEFYSKDG